MQPVITVVTVKPTTPMRFYDFYLRETIKAGKRYSKPVSRWCTQTHTYAQIQTEF